MSETPRHTLPLIAASQAQKHVTHNEAVDRLDVLVAMAIANRDLSSPPATPDAGATFLVGAGATDAWAGRDGMLAAYQEGAWIFFPPIAGMIAFVANENTHIAYDGVSWSDLGERISLGGAETFGVNTAADATNRLSVTTPAILFNAETADLRLKINKSAAGDTGTAIFQTGFSGRAECGLAGDDDWRLRVSPDGSAWADALVAYSASGAIGLPSGFAAPVALAAYTVAGLPDASGLPGALAYCSDATSGAVPVFSDGTVWRSMTDRSVVA